MFIAAGSFQRNINSSMCIRSRISCIRRNRAQTSRTPVVLDIHDVLPEFYASKFHVAHDSFMFRCLVLAERWSIAFADHAIVANHLWCERVAHRCGMPQKCSPIRNYPARPVHASVVADAGGAATLVGIELVLCARRADNARSVLSNHAPPRRQEAPASRSS